MKRYTFRLGDRKTQGAEFILTITAPTFEKAVEDGRAQLEEQFVDGKLPVSLDWGLKGSLDVDTGEINDTHLVNIETLDESHLSRTF